ncbi:putative Xaa-Pro aminopeptidase P [Venturia nashicola]|nr:putative Xaa-Pro aminopeptidase P [Venturia nashicola]
MTPLDNTGLIVRQASKQQLDLVWTLNAEAWAAPISTEDHVARERFLSQQGLTGEKWRTFVLFREEDEIIASCEAFQKEILVSERNGFRKERGYAIASVYTHPGYRRRGMAGLLLGNLAEWMDGEGGGFLSVLYSDIGKTYYEKLGWTPYSTRQLVLQSRTDMSAEADLPESYQLRDAQIEGLCEEDLEALEKEFAQPVESDDHIYIAFTPTAHQIQWHLVREDHMAKALFGREKAACRGAIAKSRRAWLIWYFDFVEKKCKIQRIVLLDKHERERNVSEIVSLLCFTQQEARRRNIERVIVWNPCDEVEEAGRLLAANFGGIVAKIEERDSSIPALRRRNDEATEKVVWKHNEYYAWC